MGKKRKKINKDIKKDFEKIPKETIVLSEKDFNKLLEHIENPPEPTEAFKKAMKEYKEKFGDKSNEG